MKDKQETNHAFARSLSNAGLGRAIAGTEQVIGRGVTIKDTTIKEHVKWDGTIFRELIGMTLSEQWPEALKNVRIEFQREA